MIIHLIAGARPNFMKIAPVLRAAAVYADRHQHLAQKTGHEVRFFVD